MLEVRQPRVAGLQDHLFQVDQSGPVLHQNLQSKIFHLYGQATKIKARFLRPNEAIHAQAHGPISLKIHIGVATLLQNQPIRVG